jgi:photosystem II stability/assembly factor-like uncharacterized protein
MRARMRWTAGATATLILAAGCAGHVRHVSEGPPSAPAPAEPASPSTTGTPSAGASSAPSQQPSSEAVGSRPRFIAMSTSFTSASQGWAWGPEYWPASAPVPGVLASTDDGGRSWRVVGAPHVPGSAYTGRGFRLSQVLFTDARVGYLYGRQLYVTTNGGRHWRRADVSGEVTAVQVVGGSAFALASDCTQADECSTGHLEQAADGSASFHDVPGIPEFDVRRASFATSRDAVVLVTPPTSSASAFRVWVEHDGAWQSHAAPCAGEPVTASAAAIDGNRLAMACGIGAGAGNQTKTVYESSDRGATWTRRANLGFTGGYVAGLAAATADTWVMSETRGGMLVSHDAGRTWRPVRILGRAEVEGWIDVRFSDSQHGAAAPSTLNGDLVAVTADGGDTWRVTHFTAANAP